MEDRREIMRIPYKSKAVIVAEDGLDYVYGEVVDISPLGLAMTVSEDTPSILNKTVIVACDTIIMYADAIREEELDGKKKVAFKARRFTKDVLQYLFTHITEEENA